MDKDLEKPDKEPFSPQTWQQALEDWDKGVPITTIEMGGIGPGYEQCIHFGVMELLRRCGTALEAGEVLEDLSGYLHTHLSAISREWQLGLSGAQAAATQALTNSYATKGYRTTIESFPIERRIIISTWWPTKRNTDGDEARTA